MSHALINVVYFVIANAIAVFNLNRRYVLIKKNTLTPLMFNSKHANGSWHFAEVLD